MPVSETAESQKRLGRAMSADARSAGMLRKQEILLELVRNGRSVSQACREMEMSRSNYERWRERYPGFRARVDAIRVTSMAELGTEFQGDFISFRQRYFGMQTYWHQREIVRAIEGAKPGEIVLVNVPPEHGKTTLLEDWCNYKLALDPNARITYVTEGLGHARKILGRVAARMTDTRIGGDYIARFGPFKIPQDHKPWSADYFRVWKADHDERDYSMEARGWKSRISGTRTDYLFIDDMQSVLSLNQTERMMETFRQDMLTRPGRNGRIVIVGTRVGVGDFSERLVEDEMVLPKNHICLPAMRDGESLCPEMWPTDVLTERRRLVKEDVWWRTYMQAPKASMDATFTDQMIEEAWSLSRHVGEASEGMVGRVAGLDPALAGGNAIHVAAYNADKYEILDIDGARGLARVEAIIERVEKMAVRYRFEDLIVETNAYQKGLSEDVRLKELARTYGFRVHVHQTGTNKMDEAIGVARMPISFIEGRITLPGADAAARAAVEPLINQLRTWRADVATRRLVQDHVMAMWFCWLFWQKKRKQLGASTEWKTRGAPWSTMSPSQWSTNRGAMLNVGRR